MCHHINISEGIANLSPGLTTQSNSHAVKPQLTPLCCRACLQQHVIYHKPANGATVIVKGLLVVSSSLSTVLPPFIVVIFVLQVAVSASKAHSAFWHKGQLLGDGRPGPLWALHRDPL